MRDPARNGGPFGADDLFVSPDGDDAWSGEHPEPTGDGDGPFRSIVRARDAIRDRREAGRFDGPVTVWVRGGRYPRVARPQKRATADGHPLDAPNTVGRYGDAEPLRFGPADAAPVTYAAYPGEEPVIDGGRRIDGFEETTVDGVDVWRTTVDAVAEGDWYVRSLFVDGERRPRARLPTDGWFEVVDPDPVPDDHRRALWNVRGERGREMGVAAGDGSPVADWHNPGDVDAVIPHKWIQNRSPLSWTDPESGRVGLELYPAAVLEGGERVAFEGVREALSDPGEWYLDRDDGELLYVPRADERPEDVTVVAPRVEQLLRVEGDPDDPVEDLRFRGLTFRHADWTHPTRLPDDVQVRRDHRHPDGTPTIRRGHEYDGAATSSQGQDAVPGALDFRDARHCGLADCTVERVGYYAVGFRPGCRGNAVVGCDLRDLGAGGVKLDGVNVTHPDERWVRNNRVTDCEIHAGGRVFPEGVGVLARHARDTTVAHNHVHDLYYTGVSVGWTWGFTDCVERDNRIEHNHIHDIGQGLLSDMGGIYMLGVQPGTRVAGNLIHGIDRYDYGGSGIYPDEGSSNITIEGNVVFDVDCAFHQHYGRENTVRNNVFVGGRDGTVALSNPETAGPFDSFTLLRNVLVAADGPLFVGGYANDWEPGVATVDANLLWPPEGAFAGIDAESPEAALDAWRSRGYDRRSVGADPEFVSTDRHDYGIPADSPATDLGIDPPDVGGAGPRPPEERE